MRCGLSYFHVRSTPASELCIDHKKVPRGHCSETHEGLLTVSLKKGFFFCRLVAARGNMNSDFHSVKIVRAAMGLSLTLGRLLFFLGLCGNCVAENCTNYKLQFERVFSVPGDVAMLNSTLVSRDVFNFSSIPYNVTWYDAKTGSELNEQTGRVLVEGATLWFLNITLEDDGEYVTIVRTPSRCFRQVTKLVVDSPIPGDCGRPKKANQALTAGVHDNLACPLKSIMSKLESYSIQYSIKWYKGCDAIEDETGEFRYWSRDRLLIAGVKPKHNGSYTCTLTFILGGVTRSVSETIEAWVKMEHSLSPRVHAPANEIIQAPIGTNFSKQCLVFVPCIGKPMVDIYWLRKGRFVSTVSTDRIHMSKVRKWSQDAPVKGVFLERELIFSEVREEDFNFNYTCRAYSDRGYKEGNFTLLPTDPCIIIPIGSTLGVAAVLFIIGMIIYYVFKIDIVLWFRSGFPMLYKNKDLDGKLYDAYVAYPQHLRFSVEVDTFALHTMPQVLENACGYKLFIAGRDCLPGQATVDSVDENIRASRRLFLLYTASTFLRKRLASSLSSHNNNNITKGSGDDDGDCDTSFNSDPEGVCSDSRQHLEQVLAMHKSLLEGTLKVVLVELEELSPVQVALLPESVRHLRKKQGAVYWWKSRRSGQRWRTCTKAADQEKGQDGELSPNLSPSSKFWKEIRYYMPVRGKRVVYPEKTALLNL